MSTEIKALIASIRKKKDFKLMSELFTELSDGLWDMFPRDIEKDTKETEAWRALWVICHKLDVNLLYGREIAQAILEDREVDKDFEENYYKLKKK